MLANTETAAMRMNAIDYELYHAGKYMPATVSVTYRFAGKEVVQTYFSAPAGKMDKPYQELAAFVKTKELLPEESDTVMLSFDIVDMAFYDMDKASWLLEAGAYVIRGGNSSRNTVVCNKMLLDETTVVKK